MSFRRVPVSVRSQVRIVAGLGLVLIVVDVLNALTGRALSQYGVVPRSAHALSGIMLAPVLHLDWQHLATNLGPLVIFSFLMLQHGLLRFVLVTVLCVTLSGGLVWLFGRPAIHIGSSGLVYGYFGYLLLAGLLSRELVLALISLFVGAAYAGMVFGVLPGEPFVSWESHLFGFIAGLLCALLWGAQRKQP
jgi:membrane associated rhomboid family serine protease